jgi:hypothetical protein
MVLGGCRNAQRRASPAVSSLFRCDRQGGWVVSGVDEVVGARKTRWKSARRAARTARPIGGRAADRLQVVEPGSVSADQSTHLREEAPLECNGRATSSPPSAPTHSSA